MKQTLKKGSILTMSKDQVLEAFWKKYFESPLPNEQKRVAKTIFFEEIEMGLMRLQITADADANIHRYALKKALNTFKELEQEMIKHD